MSDLFSSIMNLPCEPDSSVHSERQAFKRGHKQARHAAADLVATTETQAAPPTREIIAWHVVFENGAEELHLAKDISGVPAFGRWVTALTAGGPVIDQDPDEDVGS
ncbi:MULTISPECIES: hypothetical protein [Stutzerimonas]|jgi:hypothetical protein|uniref:hypothetical protein n=1 Tax=Stutzerimonas TaxID=2901164 RepID=UPI000597049C|nr:MULTISPECIES: hypothetical protein [Stutzerimonas]KIL03140.1 hypothetical protein QX25_18285 [Stutzerimonas stutzeri]